jgi:signal transduction histidine kinase
MKFAARSPFTATLAVSRVDRLIGRSLSLFLLISLLETLGTFLTQVPFLNLSVAVPSIAFFAVVLFYNVINFWFGSGTVHSYLLIGAAVFLLFATMPFQPAIGSTWPAGEHSWIWWTTGGASIGIGLLLPRWWAWAYMTAMPVTWFFVVQMPWAGSFGFAKAIEDAAYVTLFPATIVAMAQLLRSGAYNVDLAVEAASEAAAERAKVDAIERERSRIDALVHDSVLTTFLVASNANSPEEHQAAKKSAQDALEKLQKAASEETVDAISASSFAQALAEAVRRQDAQIDIEVSGASSYLLPGDVSSALADATAQAVSNSQQHAGLMTARLFRLKIAEREIKIVIRDDGPGFRPSRIPRTRLGLRVSIIARVESVGGKVFIETAPRKGTTIVLEWRFA